MKKITFLLLIFLAAIFIPFRGNAQEKEEIRSFDAKITINQDASISVTETIKYNFPSERHGIFRYIPYRYKDERNNKTFTTPVDILSVSDQYSTEKDKNNIILKIGDPNKTIKGENIYIISYKVTGAINYFSDHDELYWNITGNGWEIPISNVSADVILPPSINESSITKICFTGSNGSTEQNCQGVINKNTVRFSAPKGPLTVAAGFNKGAVSAIERKYDFQWRRETPWFWLLPIITIIYLMFKYLKTGRDPKGRGTIVPEFAPPEKLRPAEMGTLIDEGADNLDISSTIVDLAVRGYIKIVEKNKLFTLKRLKNSDENLDKTETQLMEAIFKNKDEVKLSELKSESFAKKIEIIKEELYKNLVGRNYFLKDPSAVRSGYYLRSLIFFILAVLLSWLSWHLVGALACSGILMVIFAKFMPKKTREGVIAKEKTLGFKEFIFRADRYKVKWQEKERIFEEILPYAMVFGIASVWANNFKDLYNKPPDWYEGNFGTFNAVYLASSLNSFNSTASNSFIAPTSHASSGGSGFSGGSSGGGMGGGGGGSW